MDMNATTWPVSADGASGRVTSAVYSPTTENEHRLRLAADRAHTELGTRLTVGAPDGTREATIARRWPFRRPAKSKFRSPSVVPSGRRSIPARRRSNRSSSGGKWSGYFRRSAYHDSPRSNTTDPGSGARTHRRLSPLQVPRLRSRAPRSSSTACITRDAPEARGRPGVYYTSWCKRGRPRRRR
jgi:hypothetical protein